MNKKAAKEAFSKVQERNESAYETFQSEFEKQIASGEPEEGVSRLQLLEKMIHNLNNDINASNMKYVSNMINSIDEDAIIDSKKANSKRKE